MFHCSGRASANYPVDCSIPLGSILDPIGLIVYTKDAADVISCHGIQSHFYADYMQLYTNCHPDNINDVRIKSSTCVADVRQWYASRRFQISSDKTEIIWFTSHALSARLAAQDCFLQIGSEVIRLVSVVRVLGVLLDAELTVKPHIAKTAVNCFYHLHRLRQIRRRVSEDVAVRASKPGRFFPNPGFGF
jgi:hypothetical protein